MCLLCHIWHCCVCSHLNLQKSDPPRWVSMAGEPLLYPGELGVPEGYCVFMDWFFVVEPHYSGDLLLLGCDNWDC